MTPRRVEGRKKINPGKEKLAVADTTKVISEQGLAAVFEDTDFGTADHRELIEVGILKRASGYYCGHTLTQIMTRLNLIAPNEAVLDRGRDLLRAAYHVSRPDAQWRMTWPT